MADSRVFVVEDERLVREALERFADIDDTLTLAGAADSVEDALVKLDEAAPDVAIIDLRLPDGNGIELCREIKARRPETGIVILSGEGPDRVVDAAVAGADAYLTKGSGFDELSETIAKVSRGESLLDAAMSTAAVDKVRGSAGGRGDVSLTLQQERVLTLIAEGLTNRQIADRLELAEQTVKNYVSAILHKLGLERRSQAAVFAERRRRGDER